MTILHAIGLSHLISFLLCLLTLRPMIQLGVMDHPVQRSAHHNPVPKGGGLAIIIAFLGGVTLLFSEHHITLNRFTFCLMGGTLLLCIVSWIDDIRPFPARYKLAAQILTSAIVAWGCHPSPIMILPMVMIGLISTNALNFMDGLNGLASGVMALSALFMAGMGVMPELLLLLTASLIAFIPLNFPKARIFMGDAGSQPCALILSSAEIALLGTPSDMPTSPLQHALLHHDDKLLWLFPCLLAGILWDVFFTLGRRLLARDPLAQAHRGHLYQLAVRTHLPASFVSLLHWGFTLWGGIAFCVLHGTTCLIAVSLPQCIWSIVVLKRAHHHLKEKW